MARWLSVVAHALIGWAICGATVGVGRALMSVQSTLPVHAVVAPGAFALLTWHHCRRHPASPAATALAMVSIVAGLDVLLVAPVFELSYAMFRSIIGTWVPFASMFAGELPCRTCAHAARVTRTVYSLETRES